MAKKIYLREQLQLPKKVFQNLVSAKRKEIRKTFIKEIRDPNSCNLKARNVCPTLRKNKKACDTCESCVRKIKLFEKKGKWISVPRGDKELIETLFSEFKIVDETASPKYKKHNVKFKWKKLKDQDKVKKQKKVVKEWLVDKYGQIQAPPRSGKTVIGVAIGCSIKSRVIVLANQKELIDQFATTIKLFTNYKKIKQETGKEIFAINPKPDEIHKYKFCLFTYQQFISKAGKKRLKKIKDKFGLTIVDEAHRMPAKCFTDVVDNINSRYRLGLTATPKRKDGLHFKSFKVLGPVVVEGLSEQLPCKVIVKATKLNIPKFSRWTTFINMLARSKTRDKLIVKRIVKDLEKGRKIVIPIERVKHGTEIAKRLYKEFDEGYCVREVTGSTPKPYREQYIKDAKKGKVDVLISTRKIISTGMDLPPFDTLYEIMPIANKHNFYQEVSRIRTDHPTKKKPLVRFFVDNCNASMACFSICKKVCLELDFPIKNDPTLKPKNDDSHLVMDWDKIG